MAIVDWDVHHGNGTEDAFYGDGETLTIWVHQDGCYPPGSGRAEARGKHAGLGTNVNIPLPPGSGVGAYLAAFDRVVVPALSRFAPELILVACGFDASAADPLARMMVHSGGYRAMTRAVKEVASECCDGRLVMVHEGGYSPYDVPFCGLAVLETLSGVRPGVEDPYLRGFASWPGKSSSRTGRGDSPRRAGLPPLCSAIPAARCRTGIPG